MRLWMHWWGMVRELRRACSRQRSFLWLGVALAGFTIRSEYLGVTSIVRALGLRSLYYSCLLAFFHSPAVAVEKLVGCWTSLVWNRFPLQRYHGRAIIVGDGLKVPKAGKKMPGVKRLHQESESNTKPSYIFGHSCQALAVLAGTPQSLFAVPLACKIHEGVVFSNRDRRTLLDKMLQLLAGLPIREKCYFVADAYYACRKMIRGLRADDHHLISRVKSNAVAYEHPPPRGKKPGAGRPSVYGQKIKLRTLWDHPALSKLPSPKPGEPHVVLRVAAVDLLLRPLGQRVRFVAAIHPDKGQIILMSTDLDLSPAEIIELYGWRSKIEVSFKQAIHTLGAYAYHFWMQDMKPRPRKSGNQYLHHCSQPYRDAVRRKLHAYHRFIQTGLIAQGLLQYLSCCQTAAVWKCFGSWLRTIRPGILPSEAVTAMAMRNTFPEFLSDYAGDAILPKFIQPKIDLERMEGIRLVA